MGSDNWVKTSAHVFSVEWQSKPSHEDGHWHTVYNYSVGETFYSGEFFDCGFEGGSHLKRDDVFEIEYDPKDPTRSRQSEPRSRRKVTLICFATSVIHEHYCLHVAVDGNSVERITAD